jgi:hypothetical protein
MLVALVMVAGVVVEALAPEVLVVLVAPGLRQRQTRRIWAHPPVTMAIVMLKAVITLVAN